LDEIERVSNSECHAGSKGRTALVFCWGFAGIVREGGKQSMKLDQRALDRRAYKRRLGKSELGRGNQETEAP